MSSVEATSYLPYREPDIVTILIQSAFLLVLNVVNHVLDNLIFCGLIGQIFVGVAWGTPGGKLLGQEFENVVVQLGYIGLILLVYEGGLQTKFSALKANAVLSTSVALTGIIVPILLSFSLRSLASATLLQAFAAGAALCSTSLGTTFTILKTSGLSATRLGVVLATAAMMDDVVGLVIVQVISNIGGDSFTPITVVRPIMVSIGLGVILVLSCRFVALPITLYVNSRVNVKQAGLVARAVGSTYTPIIFHAAILLSLVIGATYAGTSNLFAAYLAGASVSWWDSTFSRPSVSTATAPVRNKNGVHIDSSDKAPPVLSTSGTVNEPTSALNSTAVPDRAPVSGVATFEQFFGPILHRLFKPLFFASIGFAIPITKLFSGPIAWRGIVYTILMLFGKLVTGLWLVRFSGSIFPVCTLKSKIKNKLISSEDRKNKTGKKATEKGKETAAIQGKVIVASNEGIHLQDMPVCTSEMPATASEVKKRAQGFTEKRINRPLSLYPAAMLGTAMTARGEIGFLIASLAETTGIFSSGSTTDSSQSSKSSDIYLITTWAVVVCTIIGPLSVGTLVKRVRRLDRDLAAKNGDRREEGPLGIWGVQEYLLDLDNPSSNTAKS